MEGPARAQVEVDIYELQKDSQYDTTDTSEWSRFTPKKTSRADSHNPSESDKVQLNLLESNKV